MGKMHFDRLDDGTDQDFEIMRQVHERNLAKLPDLLLSMLSSLKGDAAYPRRPAGAQRADGHPGHALTAPTRS